MTTSDRELLWDVLAGSATVLAFVGFIEISKLYFGNYGLTLEDLLPLAYLLFSWLVIAGLRLAGWTALGRVVRDWMWLSLLVGLNVRYGAVAVQVWGQAVAVACAALVLTLGLWANRRASATVWAGLRRLVAVLPTLVVATPLLVGPLQDEPIVWLGADTVHPLPHTATVVLLFDEMNAGASTGLQKILRNHGLQVNYKPVQPVHGSTTEVVPAIFTGENFEDARPCGITRVCAEGSALDFSQVSVKRKDMDVIGFHHPYCSIQGLRSCFRISTHRNIFDINVAFCGLKRYFFQRENVEVACHKIWHQSWFLMVSEVSSKILNSPAVSKGGVLFGHVPMPHPPALNSGTLSFQYKDNIKKSEEFLDELLSKIEVAGIVPNILIFSDHPLRQSLWCTRASTQFDVPCEIDPALMDDHVPLIVAARTALPSIEHVQSNQQVFDVLREWLRH